jgi:hypothetical protein
MEDMVSAPVRGGSLDGHQVGHLFDDTEGAWFALRVSTDLAKFRFREASATSATTDGTRGGLQGAQERVEFGGPLDQEVQGDAFGGTVTHPGELLEQLTNLVEGGGHAGLEAGQLEAGGGLGHRRLM